MINFLQCQEIRCCPPGATLVERPVVNGCDQNCPACMINGRRTLTPTCCRGPEIACDQPICPEGQELILVQPQGENGRSPCCPRYRCGCPADLVCSLENVDCPPNQQARWTLDGAMDPSGCCRNAECLTPVCSSDLAIVCHDGTTHHPVWENNCAVEPCPLVCPDEGMQTCPVSRSISPNGQVQRRRGDPFIRDGVVVCEWQDCPPYEPCDDTQFTLEQRHCHHNGECVTGLDNFRCLCDENHEGTFCETRKTPPRVVMPLRDRSGSFIPSRCMVIMCQTRSNDPECFGTGALDANQMNGEGSSIEMFSITDMISNVVPDAPDKLPIQFVGVKGEELWFLNSDGNPLKINMVDYDIIVEAHSGGVNAGAVQGLRGNGLPKVTSDENSDNEFNTILNAELRDDRFQTPSITDYSYRTATEVPPVVSEWRFVQKAEATDCSVWVYYTDTAIGFYWSNYFHSMPWGPAVESQTMGVISSEGISMDTLVSTESIEVCENACLVDGVLELCNKNGICNPDTGECMCDIGFVGDKCEVDQFN